MSADERVARLRVGLEAASDKAQARAEKAAEKAAAAEADLIEFDATIAALKGESA
jgi:hypothetical protein